MTKARRGREDHNRKDAVIEAALEVFAQVGYQKASMREISSQAGMTQAAIYYHFSDKAELLMTIIGSFSRDLLDRMNEIYDAPGEPKHKLGRLIYEQIGLVGKRQKELKILMEDKVHLSDDDKQAVKLFERKIFQIYKSCLEQMQKDGDLNDIQPVVAAFAILGSVNWVYHWYREGGGISLDEVKNSILTFTLSGCCKSLEFAAELKAMV